MSRLKMHGPTYGREIITQWLRAQFPSILQDLRVEWGMNESQLPDPVLYVSREPDELDRWPLIAVTTGIEAVTRRLEHDTEGGNYLASYPVEVYSWVRAEGKGPTIEMRDAMATAIKVALLMYPTFGRTDEDVSLNEATFEQRYSELQHVKGERYVAGSLSAFGLQVYENTGPFGSQVSHTVATTAVSGYSEGTPFAQPTPLPEHPALS